MTTNLDLYFSITLDNSKFIHVLIDKVWYLVITYYLKFYQYYQDTFSCSSDLLVKTIIIISVTINKI